MARSWESWARKPQVRHVYDKEAQRLTRENHAAVAESLLTCNRLELRRIVNEQREPNLVWVIGRTILSAGENGRYKDIKDLLDHIIGKATERVQILPTPGATNQRARNFDEFCQKAGYPLPYLKQVAMMKFGIEQTGAKLILGARGYGKTDYVVICGVAWYLFNNPQSRFLLVTKSDTRNAAIIAEVAKALIANGMEAFDKQSASELRIAGLRGKDPSLGGVTIRSTSIRGRHPDKIIMDDPVTEEDVSEATRRQVQRTYNELSKVSSDLLIIGQPVHKFDLYETLRPLVNKMEVPHGSIPELDHDLEAQRLAGVSEESIQASYFLKVISENGNPFENISYVDKFPVGTSVAFIDPSFKGGDYTAMSVVRAYLQGVVVYGKVWKRAWFNCFDEIQQVVTDKQVAKLCFETNCLGEQPILLLRDFLDGCTVAGKDSTGNKHSRILAAGAFAKSIFLAKDSHPLYLAQVAKYEYGAENDDAPDSLASALEWIGLIRGKTA